MKEADWTLSPHVEREAASLRRRMRWEGQWNVWIAGASGTTAALSWFFLVDLIERRASWGEIGLFASIALATGGLTVYVAVRDAALKRMAMSSDEARREELGRGVGWLVELMILQGAAPTGTDRGMLWIEGDRLCFSGDRTSFALSSDQLAGRCEIVVPIRGLRHATRIPLACRTSGGRLGLSLRPDTIDVVGFRRAIGRWAAIPSTDGQFPPTRIGPGAASPSRLFLAAAFGTAYWMVAAILVWSSFNFTAIDFGSLVLGLLLALVGLLFRLPLVLRWRALRDRWRLDRGNG